MCVCICTLVYTYTYTHTYKLYAIYFYITLGRQAWANVISFQAELSRKKIYLLFEIKTYSLFAL